MKIKELCKKSDTVIAETRAVLYNRSDEWIISYDYNTITLEKTFRIPAPINVEIEIRNIKNQEINVCEVEDVASAILSYSSEEG